MSDVERCEHGDLFKMLDDALAARDASEAARKEAEDSLDHERVRHSETQAELDEIGRILDERYRLLKVRHDALAAQRDEAIEDATEFAKQSKTFEAERDALAATVERVKAQVYKWRSNDHYWSQVLWFDFADEVDAALAPQREKE